MRIAHAVAAGALILLFHGTAAAPPVHRWKLSAPEVPHDPICEKLEKVIDDYFRRYPKMPDECVDAALGGAFSMPDWTPLPNPSLEFVARIEKFMQVGSGKFFSDQDKGLPIESVYFYRAKRFEQRERQMLFRRVEMADQFTFNAKVPGKVKTFLQYRSWDGGCDGKPDQKTLENLVLMDANLSGPLRLEDSSISGLLFGSRLRLDHGTPILINGGDVLRQYPNGFGPVCSFKKSNSR